MAAIVSSGKNQLPHPIPAQQKKTRNKRKFRAETPQAGASKLGVPLDKPQLDSCSNQGNACDLCSLHRDQLNFLKAEVGQEASGFDRQRKEPYEEEFQDADWSDITESQLEELLLSNLDTIFKSAIKRIVSYGFSEEIATKAVLRSGLCYGCKDTASNIVDNTLAFLKNSREVHSSKEHFFEDLVQLERYILAEMVCVLREVRPFFSTGDAMWCLLICDLNVSHACALDSDSINSLDDDSASEKFSNPPDLTSSDGTDGPTPNSFVQNLPKPNKVDPTSSLPSKLSTVNNPNLPMAKPPKSSEHPVFEGKSKPLDRGKSVALQVSSKKKVAAGEESVPTLPLSHMPVSDEKRDKILPSRKNQTQSVKKESSLRQKMMHFEKSYRAYGVKSALKSGKLGAYGSLVLDKKCKSLSENTIASFKNASLKLTHTLSAEASQKDKITATFSASLEAVSGSGRKSNMKSGKPSLPLANTDLSLSLASKGHSSASSETADYVNSKTNCISREESLGQVVPRCKKDEMLQKLGPRVKELQSQMQVWNEWAQQKVVQAARRLGKDKAELKSLRQEKEEVVRLKKEKQNLEENTMKKLTEMENTLCTTSEQVKLANAAVQRLEEENIKLSRELITAKVRAAESAASCEEVTRREMDTLKKIESWEKQKLFHQEELLVEKRKMHHMQQQLKLANDMHNKLEVRFKQECDVKNEALALADLERKEREQNEALGKLNIDMIRVKGETDLERFKDEIRKLENEIVQLRLKTGSSKIGSLKWCLDGSFVSPFSDGRDTKDNYVSNIAYSQDENGVDVLRERECVMCLTEEMSVVFLPCAHQVVCTKCNELHQRQGMKDCPSCRAPIQQRVCVRWAEC